jgi:DNA repair ATPase RecN
VWKEVVEADSLWAYADQGSYKMTLRKTYKTWHKAKETAEKLKASINERFSDEVLYERFCDEIYKPDPEVEEWLSELEEMTSV